MANATQIEAQRLGGSTAARQKFSQILALTMAAGATVSGSIAVPEGAWLDKITAEVATAISGAPTNINLRCGSAAAGQQVVADVDVKAQGHTTCTIVSTFDSIAGITTYFFQLAAVGGTNPAGTVNVRIDYYPPNK